MSLPVSPLSPYELLITYAWHRQDDILDCPRYWDRLPNTAAEWARSPKTCKCGFSQQLHIARTNA